MVFRWSFVLNVLWIKVTKQYSSNAAHGGHVPAMELLSSYAKELGKEISDEYYGKALYQMYCR